jgi:hypothetical protein
MQLQFVFPVEALKENARASVLEMLNGTDSPEIFESRKRPPPQYFPLDHSSGGVFGNQSEHDWL